MILSLLFLFLFAPQETSGQISQAQKNEFIQLLKSLPNKGDFFTDEAVNRTAPYLPVLFALTDKDLEGKDIYPFRAISRGLCDIKEHRVYATKHFGDIRHSELKLLWAT